MREQSQNDRLAMSEANLLIRQRHVAVKPDWRKRRRTGG